MLTQQERQVIIFLTAIGFLGVGINFFTKTFVSTKQITSFSKDLGKIDINQADKYLLVGIPGIGEKLAQRIIQYRQTQGSFENLDALKNVKGISESKLKKLKDYLKAGG